MHLSFVVNHIYLNGGWSPWDTRIGGSEEFVVEVSKRLAQRGHQVKVFHNGKHGIYGNVQYLEHDDFEAGDLTINVNFPEFTAPGKQILWSSLTDHPDLSKFEAVCAISEYAKQYTNIHHKNVNIVPPGYDPEKIYPGRKIVRQCFYASSPDRGLSTLLDVWPEVHEEHPDATLILTYGADINLPGIINLGNVDEDTMNEIYRTSDIWCHPANGGELYCMTGVKAQAAGCVPVIIPIMALQETVRDGVFVKSPGEYAKVLNKTLADADLRQEIRDNLVLEKYPTWEDSTDKLLEVIEKVV